MNKFLRMNRFEIKLKDKSQYPKIELFVSLHKTMRIKLKETGKKEIINHVEIAFI